MQVEDLLEMIACLRVFKLPNFEARGELALGFWRYINPHVTYKKLMLQSYFLTRDHFYICDKFAHGPMEKDEVYLCGYVVLVLLFVALWFILRGDWLYVFPCVILFLCFSVLLVL